MPNACQVEPNTLSSFHISSVLELEHSFLVAEPARAFHRVVEMPLLLSSTIPDVGNYVASRTAGHQH